VLAFLGTAVAWYDGYFHLGHALLAFFGLLLAHISVNVFNEYFDYRSGVDFATQRTPFSGGSGALPTGLVKPDQALWLAVGTLAAIIPIGIYFIVVKGWLLLPLLIVAALCIVLYTPFILKTGWPEWVPGVGLGILPVLGAYFVQTGTYTLPAFIASVPSGILVHNLLLLNEFPDVAADTKVGRRTMPIVMGKRGASIVYSALTVSVYVWIIGWVIAGVMPLFALIALLTLPFALKAIQGALKYEDMSRLVPGMANNVLFILTIQLLLGIGYILAKVF
jgi:1,4-dihydroxy-2-naphthoate octaprenyltransferase